MRKPKDPKSKRVGSTLRAEEARNNLRLIFSDENHPLYFAKDIEFARRFDVTRITIYKIRDSLGVLPRSERLLKKLQQMDLMQYTLKDLSKSLNIKYQNLYKIIQENGLKVKPDTPPIDYLKKYQAERKIGKRKPVEEKSAERRPAKKKNPRNKKVKPKK